MGIFFSYSAQKQGGVLIDAFLKTSPNLSKRKGKDGQESIQKMRHPLVLSSLVDAATTKQEETILWPGLFTIKLQKKITFVDKSSFDSHQQKLNIII